MDQATLTENKPEFDADGFMLHPDQWSETWVNRHAQMAGLDTLSPEQLELLQNLRAEFAKTGAVSAYSHVCHLGGQEPDCMQQLFPSPLHAWRLAGLPNPGEEAKAYMSNK
ncbi:MAG: TusE/DsrC/DsvC family sulfur relay protein [Thiobacillus sp.]